MGLGVLSGVGKACPPELSAERSGVGVASGVGSGAGVASEVGVSVGVLSPPPAGGGVSDGDGAGVGSAVSVASGVEVGVGVSLGAGAGLTVTSGVSSGVGVGVDIGEVSVLAEPEATGDAISLPSNPFRRAMTSQSKAPSAAPFMPLTTKPYSVLSET